MSLKLYTVEVSDEISRENFFRINNYVREDNLRKSRFRFFEFSVLSAVTNLKIPHKLTFTPLDVISLSVRNSDATIVTWHYDDFDKTNVVVSTSGPCTVRIYLGRYEES